MVEESILKFLLFRFGSSYSKLLPVTIITKPEALWCEGLMLTSAKYSEAQLQCWPHAKGRIRSERSTLGWACRSVSSEPLPIAVRRCLMFLSQNRCARLTQLAASSFFLNGTLVSGSTMITALTIQQPLMHRLELRAFNCLGWLRVNTDDLPRGKLQGISN